MTDPLPPGRQSIRADARRNRERLLSAAREEFAAHGPDAPLDAIAQRAALGSGTLYRHFPTREALMRAVYWGEIESLCASGRELLDSPSPAEALFMWLRLLLATISRRGLAAALMASMSDVPSRFITECHDAIRTTAAGLLDRAQEAGGVRSDVTLSELLDLTHAIGLATERAPEGVDRADRLLSLMIDGVRAASPAAAERRPS